MTNLLSITTNDINTSINHEPRILDITLADALGFARAVDIRDLIIRHKEALEKFGELFFRTVRKNAKGRPSTEYWLTKKQALYICTKSQTANATEVTIQMVEVFDQVTSGKTITVKSHVRKIKKQNTLPAVVGQEDEFLNLGDIIDLLTAPYSLDRIIANLPKIRQTLLEHNALMRHAAHCLSAAFASVHCDPYLEHDILRHKDVNEGAFTKALNRSHYGSFYKKMRAAGINV